MEEFKDILNGEGVKYFKNIKSILNNINVEKVLEKTNNGYIVYLEVSDMTNNISLISLNNFCLINNLSIEYVSDDRILIKLYEVEDGK